MNAATLVRRLFALPDRDQTPPPVPASVVEAAWPAPGEVTLITGGSGGGKSRLLAAMRQHGDLLAAAGTTVRWIEPGQITLGTTCVVDLVCDELEGITPPDVRPANAAPEPGGPRVEAALELLSRVGLAEAWTYLQKPAELSDGQRWRLRLALAVARALRQHPASPSATDAGGPICSPLSANGPRQAHADRPGIPTVTTIIAIDEFAAVLDRVTARVVARALRRLIDRPGPPRLAAIIATSHDDLRLALSPDRQVTADFGVYQAGDGSIAIAHAVKRKRRGRLAQHLSIPPVPSTGTSREGQGGN